MAKKRTKRTQPVVKPKPLEIDVEKVQATTLITLEEWTAQAPRAEGVSVLQCCMYDIVQAVNSVFAREITK